ncbi:MAG: MGMT family protein [Patescibacteria group bacterium]
MRTFQKIYNIVSLIPKGKVLTYKKVAELAGIKNSRVVGFAMHSNKDTKLIPCHRVVGISGKLTGYARGGIKRKKEILEKEGVYFLDNQTVALDKSLYRPQKKTFRSLQSLGKTPYLS